MRPGNGQGLLWFRSFINLSLTYLLTHSPRPTWGNLTGIIGGLITSVLPAIFQTNLGSSWFASSTIWRRILDDNGLGYVHARCSSCHQTNSVQPLKGTQSIEPNRGPRSTGLMLTWSRIHRSRQSKGMPLCQLSIASTLLCRLLNYRGVLGIFSGRVRHENNFRLQWTHITRRAPIVSSSWNLHPQQHSRTRETDKDFFISEHHPPQSLLSIAPLLCSKQHLSSGDCLEDNGEDFQNCSVLCWVDSCAQWYAHMYAVHKFECWFTFSLDLYLPFVFFAILFWRCLFMLR